MPKYIPSMPFEDCYGSVGDLTFYHRNGQCYYRKRASPEALRYSELREPLSLQ